MRTLWIEQSTPTMRETSSPEPGSGEALLSLRVAAIAPMDLVLPASFAGTPGTEVVAQVLDSPNPDLVGQRVLLVHPVPCGLCLHCYGGRPHHCAHPRSVYGQDMSGGLATRFVYPAHALVPVPDKVRDYDAAMAYGVAAMRAAGVAAAEARRVLVMGIGARPPVAALSLSNHATDVYLSTTDEARAERFKRFGILRDPGGTFPLVVACPRSTSDVELAIRRVSAGGQLLIDSAGLRSGPVDLGQVYHRHIRLGTLPPPNLSEALERVSLREVCEALSKVREDVVPLAEADKAMALAGQTPALQILVDNL